MFVKSRRRVREALHYSHQFAFIFEPKQPYNYPPRFPIRSYF